MFSNLLMVLTDLPCKYPNGLVNRMNEIFHTRLNSRRKFYACDVLRKYLEGFY